MKKILITLSLLALCILPITASALSFPSADELFPTDAERAEQSVKVNEDGTSSADEINQERTRDVVPLPKGDLFTKIIPQVLRLLLYAMGLVILVVLTYAGIRLVIARGNEEQITKVKELVVQILLGIAIVGAAYGIVSGILSVFSKL